MRPVDRVPTKREPWTFRKRYLPLQRALPCLGRAGLLACIAAFFTDGAVRNAMSIPIVVFGLTFGVKAYLQRKHRLLYTNYFVSRGIRPREHALAA